MGRLSPDQHFNFSYPSIPPHNKNLERERENLPTELAEIIQAEELILNQDSSADLLKQWRETERRYVHLVCEKKGGQPVFLKILKPNSDNPETAMNDTNAFLRELSVSRLLKKTGVEALAVLSSNTPQKIADPEKPNPDNKIFYALIETLEAEGFIHNYKEIAKLKPKQAAESVKKLMSVHGVIANSEIKISLAEKIHNLQDHWDSVAGYNENTKKILSLFEFEEETDEEFENYVWPLDGDEIMVFFKNAHPEEFKQLEVKVAGQRVENKRLPFWVVLEYRLQNQVGKKLDFRSKISEMMDKNSMVAKKFDGTGEYLTHGDCSPNNLYVNKDGTVRLLDFEWSGLTNNRILAMVMDVGNLRARAWNNADFRQALDKAVLVDFKEALKAKLIKDLMSSNVLESAAEVVAEKEALAAAKATLSMAILRSHANLAAFFENFPAEKQADKIETMRRKNTEQDLVKAFEYAEVDL